MNYLVNLYISLTAALILVVIYTNAAKNDNKIKRILKINDTNKRDPFAGAQDVKCDNKTMSKMDSLIAKLLTVGQKSRRFPENPSELRQFCNEGRKMSSFFKGYAYNCFNEFIKRIVKAMYYPIDNEIRLLCKSGRPSKRAEELMVAAKCGNAAREGLQRCNEKFIDTMVAMKTLPQKKIITMGCCNGNAMRECAKREAEEHKECNRRTVDYFERYLLQFSGGFINIACGEYFDNSDRCDSVWAQLPKLNRTNYVRPKSFFMPAMSLMDSMPEFDV